MMIIVNKKIKLFNFCPINEIIEFLGFFLKNSKI